MFVSRSLPQRLAELSMPVTESGCHVWTGHCNEDGYALVVVDGHPRLAHREAFALLHGPQPPSVYILHRCDVRCCINPAHLFPGDAGANIRDCKAKGRNSRGEDRWSAILTESEVRQIRRERMTQKEIVGRYRVSRACAWAILVGRTWKHVHG